jgi:hypothetical protein
VASMTVLRTKKDPCTECGLAAFAAANGYELRTPWGGHDGPTTPLVWRCLACGADTTMSLAVMGRTRPGRHCRQ